MVLYLRRERSDTRMDLLIDIFSIPFSIVVVGAILVMLVDYYSSSNN